MAASVQAPLEAADPLMQSHGPSPLLEVVDTDGAAFLLASPMAPTRVGSPLPSSCAAASTECTAGEVVGPFAHKETCVVLDWDDTLFPSSFGAWASSLASSGLGWGVPLSDPLSLTDRSTNSPCCTTPPPHQQPQSTGAS